MKSFGTHDSFTYLKPKSFWGWFALPFYRTQKKDLEEQLYEGWTCIDMRVTFVDGMVTLAHGIVKLKSDTNFVWQSLNQIENYRKYNTKNLDNADMYVRVILEDTKVIEKNEGLFKNFCAQIIDRYPHIKFFGGNRRCDWKQVYTFAENPALAQMVGSMAPDARWYEKLIPWFYAKRMNDENMDLEYTEDVIIFDFV